MPMPVCGWASSLWWGRGRLCFKLCNWLTSAFPCKVLAVFVQHGIKTLLARNTRGTVTYTKHHHNIILSLSYPHVCFPSVFTDAPRADAHTCQWHIIRINRQQLNLQYKIADEEEIMRCTVQLMNLVNRCWLSCICKYIIAALLHNIFAA